MIRDPSGTLYATRGKYDTWHGTGTFHGWPIRVVLHRAADIDGKPTVSVQIYDGDEISDTRHALGPSVLIDGFGHEDQAPRGPEKRRRA